MLAITYAKTSKTCAPFVALRCTLVTILHIQNNPNNFNVKILNQWQWVLYLEENSHLWQLLFKNKCLFCLIEREKQQQLLIHLQQRTTRPSLRACFIKIKPIKRPSFSGAEHLEQIDVPSSVSQSVSVSVCLVLAQDNKQTSKNAKTSREEREEEEEEGAE
mgnify:CR=1 FL=1